MTPIVLLHGIGADAPSFAPLIAALAPHPAVAFNMPGYGDQPAVGPLTFESLRDHVLAQMDSQNIASAHLFGHSIGGMIGMELALAAPERLKSLILCNTTSAFGGGDDSFKKAFLKARLAPLDAGLSMGEVGAQAAPHLVGDSAPQSAIEQTAAAMGRIPGESFRAAVDCLVTFDRRADFPEIVVPTLLIAGTQDSNAPAKTMRRMAERLPSAQYQELNTGHLAPLEAPKEVARAVTAFLRETGKTE